MTEHDETPREVTFQPLETCRSCRDEREYGAPGVPADVIVWGKLFPQEALGPRCMAHFYEQTDARRVEGYAVLDLRGLTRA